VEAGTHEAQRSLGQRLLADEIIEADRLDPLAEGELVSPCVLSARHTDLAQPIAKTVAEGE
jgi:hypothetical protein